MKLVSAKFVIFAILGSLHCTMAFRATPSSTSSGWRLNAQSSPNRLPGEHEFNPMGDLLLPSTEDNLDSLINPSFFAPALAGYLAMQPSAASAAASDYGIFAGRTASLLHPVTNFALFFTSLYAAYLGFQWRRLREIGDEIKSLTKEMPMLSSGQARSPIADTIKSINAEISKMSASEDPDAAAKVKTLQGDLKMLQGATDLDAQIKELSNTRKQLVSMNLRDKHHLAGSYLLGAGITVSVLGAFNTYMRAGKLFPGPHLYAGMGIVISWAVAASLVPAMQKGNDTARIAHIAFNIVNLALFAWQLPTGLEITLKVLEKTSWP